MLHEIGLYLLGRQLEVLPCGKEVEVKDDWKRVSVRFILRLQKDLINIAVDIQQNLI